MVIHARHNLHIVDKAAPSPSLAILYPFVGASQSVVSHLSIPRILSINPSTVSTVHISNSNLMKTPCFSRVHSLRIIMVKF